MTGSWSSCAIIGLPDVTSAALRALGIIGCTCIAMLVTARVEGGPMMAIGIA